jgi:putative phage-type endonuclease
MSNLFNSHGFQQTQSDDHTDIIMEVIEEYLQEHYTILAEPEAQEILTQDLLQLFCPTLDLSPSTKKKRSKKLQDKEEKEEEDTNHDDDHDDDIEQHIEEAIQHFFTFVMPRRSFQTSFTFLPPNVEKIQAQLQHLRNKPQPAQRTVEWYQFRHNLITASELSKVFETQAQQNNLIFSKCKPWEPMGKCNNPSSPLHWGQKYEPLSIMLYEHIYSTKVGEFGCIPHDTLPFLGASPDGINIDPACPRFGRLLEIKNVFSRNIDGIPLKEYWIQMQAQMEVCNLDECDFLETKFIEYSGYREYVQDKFVQGSFVEHNEEEDNDNDNDNENNAETTKPCPYKFKGCIMMFVLANTQTPIYEFKPLMLNDDDEETVWEEETIRQYENKGYQWITNIYWKLQVFSCVLVLRNRFWFQSCVPQIRQMWETIERERVTGYEHRAPKSRSKKIEVTLLGGGRDPAADNCHTSPTTTTDSLENDVNIMME